MTQSERLAKLKKLQNPLSDVFDRIERLNEILKGDTGPQGPQGEPGYTPVRGEDYYTEEDINSVVEYIQSRVKDGEKGEKGERGEKGKDGQTPFKGIDYWTKEDQAKIVEETLKKIVIPRPKDGVSPDIKDVVAAATKELAKVPFDIKKILNSPELRILLRGGGGSGGGAGSSVTLKTNDTNNGSQSILNLKQGANVTITDDGVGGVTINSTGGSGGGHTIQDEGVSLTQRSKLNFIGAAVTATDNAGNDSTDVTITASSGSNIQTLGRNSTGSTLYRGMIVYMSGSTGNVPNFSLSQANSEATSSRTYGVVVDDISNNSDGYVLNIGSLTNLDTRTTATNPFTVDTLADGDTVYLSPTNAGYITNVKPSAPNHLVYIGKVVRAHPTLGYIQYQIQNGYELDELHDVTTTNYPSPINADSFLVLDSVAALWKRTSLTSLKSVLKTYFDSLYLTSTGSGASLTGITAAQVSAIPSSYLDTDTTLTTNSDVKVATQKAIKTYVDSLVAGLLDYRGGYNASGGTYPTTGGSGASGAVSKGDMWVISVAGTLGGSSVHVGDSIIANIDTPGQTAGNWNTVNANISYVPEDQANKSTDGTLAANSTTLYPSQSAVKTYADTKALLAGSTSQAFQTSQLEVGHASDATLSRSAAGVLAVEGVVIPSISSTNTLTNKTLISTTNVVEEITTTASSATPAPTGGSLRNYFTVTALAAGATFSAPSGTPVDGNILTIRIKDNGTARTLAWNAIYRAIGVTLPTTTVLSKTLYLGCRYNGADSKWDVLAVAQEA